MAQLARRMSAKLRKRQALALLPLAALLGGCESDSFLDPSVTGRWEQTPTVVPILDRLSAIEDESGEYVQSSPITAQDLIPEPDQYRLGPGDQIEVRIRDYFVVGVEEPFVRTVDPRGNVEIPRLPPVRALGKTSAEFQLAVEDAIRGQRINDRPIVAVNVQSQRKQTFSALGAVRTPGTYFIPTPDYRLLEGITAAGGSDETIPYVYVIRQTTLSDEASGILPPPEPVAPRPGPPKISPSAPAEPPKRSEELIELIDELSKQPKGGEKPAPAMRAGTQPTPATRQPATGESEQPRSTGPAIDLPDAHSDSSATAGGTRTGWVYVDGKWVKVTPTGEVLSGAAAMGGNRPVTQRVIKVPMGPLLAGSADVNIVLRPGDVIRIPAQRGGLVYFGGQVARPGVIALPTDGNGRLTLLRGIDSVGGLGGLAIPERVDLTRVVGEGRQATIRVNLRAIAEQTQPDLYLKADDRINVGTNFFAVPLAVFRGGLRASYGFGFILDRNFQGDVFGVDRATSRN